MRYRLASVEGTCNILVLNHTAEDNLMSFRFKKGGTLITEDSTAALMADYGLGFEILLIMRAFGGDVEGARPRVLMQFAASPNEVLLSGGQTLSRKALILDRSGDGRQKAHTFLASTPCWNWNGLDTGKAEQDR